MVNAIRILVANRPRLMRDLIVSTFADQPGIEIVGEVSDEAEIPARVKQSLPNLLVIALDEPGKRPQVCDAILREHPDLRILAVASRENRTICYWASLDIHSDEIDPSGEGILKAVRSMTQSVGHS
jgi:DNA-binding NarL/FixJ family response regulator